MKQNNYNGQRNFNFQYKNNSEFNSNDKYNIDFSLQLLKNEIKDISKTLTYLNKQTDKSINNLINFYKKLI